MKLLFLSALALTLLTVACGSGDEGSQESSDIVCIENTGEIDFGLYTGSKIILVQVGQTVEVSPGSYTIVCMSGTCEQDGGIIVGTITLTTDVEVKVICDETHSFEVA